MLQKAVASHLFGDREKEVLRKLLWQVSNNE